MPLEEERSQPAKSKDVEKFLKDLKLSGGALPLLARTVCAAEFGMVFRVLSSKLGIQFHYLVSIARCLFAPECER